MDTESQANETLVTELMERFGRDMNGWYDNLHENCVVEFPFGPTVGMPGRIEGKEACTALFTLVCDAVQVQFSNIVVHALADPSMIMAEYTGYSEPQGQVYDQTYICILQIRDGKVLLYKEYWNSAIVRDAFGDLSAMFP